MLAVFDQEVVLATNRHRPEERAEGSLLGAYAAGLVVFHGLGRETLRVLRIQTTLCFILTADLNGKEPMAD